MRPDAKYDTLLDAYPNSYQAQASFLNRTVFLRGEASYEYQDP